jgi:hypothetical protein
MTPINRMMATEPKFVNVHRNQHLKQVLSDWRHLLRTAHAESTKAKELTHGVPGYIGMVDSSGEGVGGVVFGHLKPCTPTVFRLEWPWEIKDAFQKGILTNSDLEMAGYLLCWLVMEAVVPSLRHVHVAILNVTRLPLDGWTKWHQKGLWWLDCFCVHWLCECVRGEHRI